MYNALVKLGHDVTVYSPKLGILAPLMKTTSELTGLIKPDVILGQHYRCSTYMRAAFPDVPFIFSSHGTLPDPEQPPRIKINRYIAIHEDVVANLISQYVEPYKIDIVRDFIDTEKFKPTSEPNLDLKKVLFISNYKQWKNYEAVSGACKMLDLELKCIGSPYGRCKDVAAEINNADLVISWARGILEAMACGRPCISFDQELGDGYITSDVYKESRTRNFSGRRCRHYFNQWSLAEEIKKYKWNDGAINRSIVLKFHEANKGAQQIMEVIEKIL
jgi:glycosyltransferase involved in cell wall biosynthesis